MLVGRGLGPAAAGTFVTWASHEALVWAVVGLDLVGLAAVQLVLHLSASRAHPAATAGEAPGSSP